MQTVLPRLNGEGVRKSTAETQQGFAIVDYFYTREPVLPDLFQLFQFLMRGRLGTQMDP
jgi:hypothetical protein